jgi:inosine/xanthosine triphosphatase
MLIAVGSLNPSKIEAVRLGFEAYFPNTQKAYIGTAAASGISDQPMSTRESLTGARNRAKRALELAPEAQYGVGLEGGLQQVHNHWFDTGWIVVRDREGNEGMGSTVGMPVADEVINLMLSRNIELGLALDEHFGTVNLKHAQGHFGLMTDNRITRATGYRDAVIVALSHLQRANPKSEILNHNQPIAVPETY